MSPKPHEIGFQRAVSKKNEANVPDFPIEFSKNGELYHANVAEFQLRPQNRRNLFPASPETRPHIPYSPRPS